MLPKRNRLKRKKDFERVAIKGRGFFVFGISCKIIQNKLKNNRYAIIVSKKIHKKAVKRNRIRRRISDILRLLHPSLDNRGYDLFLLVNKDIQEKTPLELKNMVWGLMKKSGLLPDIQENNQKNIEKK